MITAHPSRRSEANHDPLHDVLSRLEGVKQHGDEWRAKCPGHNDQKPSLSVKRGDDGRVLMWCGAGCSHTQICGAIGIEPKDLFPLRNGSNGKHHARQRRIVATYDYTDRDGTLLYQSLRYEPKDFRQRRPDGDGGWIYDMKGVDPVLYRLPELMEAEPDEWVYVVEGEKDVDRLREMGPLATTSPMGAGKWRPEYSETLRDRRVVILPDNDEPGRKHGQEVASSLHGIASEVKVVELPGLPPKGDVSDFLNAGGTVDDLMMLVSAAPIFKPTSAPAQTIDEHPHPDADVATIAGLLTDVGNAARFVLRHGRDSRFCYGTGKWYVWTGKRWMMDESGRVNRWGQQTALSIYREAADEANDGDRRAKLVEWAKSSQKRDRINAMIELAKPYLCIAPAEMDAAPLLVNCDNGTVDVGTGELRPHRREDFLTRICNASYRPRTNAPVYEAFLERIFLSHPDLIGYAQKTAGYGATGLTNEQVLFFLYGTGANGKTTLLDAWQHALGDYAGKADRDLLTARDGAVHPTNIADLMGRRMVVCSETNEGGRFDEAKLKDLVGETRLKARYMRQDFFEFTATHKVFVYSNHKPLVRGTDFGFWRRMRLIPFIETIDEEEKDPELPAKLRAEADGILTWIIEGAILWHREGLGLPDEVAKATDGYRREMDNIGAFLAECCLSGEKMTASARDLFKAYVNWCEDVGEKPLSQKRLGMQLTERGHRSDRDTYSGRKLWSGIGLKTPPEVEQPSFEHESFGKA